MPGAVPVAHTLILFVWRRKIDWIGVAAVVSFAIGLTIVLLGGGILSLKLYHPIFTGSLGLIFLISVAINRPFLMVLLRTFKIGDQNRLKNPTVYKKVNMITEIFGILLVADAVIHIVLALTQPTNTYVVLDRIVTITIVVLMFLILRFNWHTSIIRG